MWQEAMLVVGIIAFLAAMGGFLMLLMDVSQAMSVSVDNFEGL